MDELREAVRALADEAQVIETAVADGGEVPTGPQLAALQTAVDRIQQALNRLQTAMDTWTQETESV
jgi:hypothetical protein